MVYTKTRFWHGCSVVSWWKCTISKTNIFWRHDWRTLCLPWHVTTVSLRYTFKYFLYISHYLGFSYNQLGLYLWACNPSSVQPPPSFYGWVESLLVLQEPSLETKLFSLPPSLFTAGVRILCFRPCININKLWIVRGRPGPNGLTHFFSVTRDREAVTSQHKSHITCLRTTAYVNALSQARDLTVVTKFPCFDSAS